MSKPATIAFLGVVLPLLAACHAASRVDTTGPTVTYRYQYGELGVVHEQADTYCLESYGQRARLISADDRSGVATFECIF